MHDWKMDIEMKAAEQSCSQLRWEQPKLLLSAETDSPGFPPPDRTDLLSYPFLVWNFIIGSPTKSSHSTRKNYNQFNPYYTIFLRFFYFPFNLNWSLSWQTLGSCGENLQDQRTWQKHLEGNDIVKPSSGFVFFTEHLPRPLQANLTLTAPKASKTTHWARTVSLSCWFSERPSSCWMYLKNHARIQAGLPQCRTEHKQVLSIIARLEKLRRWWQLLFCGSLEDSIYLVILGSDCRGKCS